MSKLLLSDGLLATLFNYLQVLCKGGGAKDEGRRGWGVGITHRTQATFP